MGAVLGWLDKLTSWILDLVIGLFLAVWAFLLDLMVEAIDWILTAGVELIASIPIPQFMQGGVGDVYGQMDSGILYVLGQVGIGAALGIIGVGFTFRFLRKVATLFQW